MDRKTLLPRAELLTIGSGPGTRRVLVGVPPCLKVFGRTRTPLPNIFVCPDEFFSDGVPQLALEFFVYDALFVPKGDKPGLAFRPFEPSERLVVVGTADQLARAKRVTEITLFGFSPDEMRSWMNLGGKPALRDADVATLRKYDAWFSPKRVGFTAFQKYIVGISATVTPHQTLAEFIGTTPETLAELPLLTQTFVERHGAERFTAPFDLVLAAYEFARFTLDDIIEWRAYDASDTADLAGGVRIRRRGGNQFTVQDADGSPPITLDLNSNEDQAPHLITLPPSPHVLEAGVFQFTCLGSVSGFDLSGETTGWLLDILEESALIDTPLCAAALLRHIGRDPASIRVIGETHVHEDHQGAGAAAALGAEYLKSGCSFTYVGSEPAFRGFVVKAAAYLGISEADAYERIVHHPGDPVAASQSVIRVRPGDAIRLLGATWEFPAWNPHPVPTMGFRIALDYRGRTYRVAYTSDTAPKRGFLGTDAMRAAGFMTDDDDPLPRLIKDGDDLAFWESGGTGGDPIHPDIAEYGPWCVARGFTRPPPVVAMHTGTLPPSARGVMLARPGASFAVIRPEIPVDRRAPAIERTLDLMPVTQRTAWLRRFAQQGAIVEFLPTATVIAEGEVGDAFYLLLNGEADVLVGGKRVGGLSAHAFFGELALLGNGTNGTGTRRATVRAKTPIVCLKIPADVFRDFVVAEDLTAYFAEFWTRVGVLKKTRLFVGFPHEVIERLVGRVETRTFAVGETLIQQGTIGDELFVIQEGEVEVVREGADGVTPIATLRGTGEVVGEYGAFVPGGTRTATVRACTPVTVLVLTRSDLTAVLAGQLPLELRFQALLERRGITQQFPAVAAP